MADTRGHVDDTQLLPPEMEEKKAHISQNLRVLAIDDNVVCLKVLAFQLRKCGYQVTATTEASEALELLRKNKNDYDIVITDVVRSDMDGFKILEIVGLELDIPVIMTSADDDMRTVERGVRHGARDYLVKPVRIEILRNIWQHVIRKTVYNPKSDPVEAKIVKEPKPNKRHQRDDNESGQSTEESLAQKKPRVVWNPMLHEKFVNAVQQLEVDKAVPKKILEIMNEPDLTRENVASHLQKYRNLLKKEKERTVPEMTNGMPHLCNPIIHATAVGNHGLPFNHSNGYSAHGISSLIGRNHPFLPVHHHGVMLQQRRALSEDMNQKWKNMAIPLVKNVAPGTTLTANPDLSAMKHQILQNQRNMVNHNYGQISSPFTPADFGPRHPESCPNLIVGNSSGSLPILSSRPYSYSPASFNPTVPLQVGYTQSFPDSSVRGNNGHCTPPVPDSSVIENNGHCTPPVPDSSVIENNGHYTQPFPDTSVRENNIHQMIEDSPDDDDLSLLIKQFANDTAPAI